MQVGWSLAVVPVAVAIVLASLMRSVQASDVPRSGPAELAEPSAYVPVKPPLRRIVGGGGSEKVVAVTFDDGPHAGYTDRLLALLQAEGAVATHFFVGRNVRRHPELARAVAFAGHEVANHSENHVRLDALPARSVPAELARCSEAIEEATGVRPAFFRPPGGWGDSTVDEIADSLGMTVALWTLSAGDYTAAGREPTAAQIAERVLQGVQPGSVVILHDPMPQTLDALPQIVRGLRDRGYRFVTMSELAAMPGARTAHAPAVQPRRASPVRALLPDSPG
jgi:peptidoglycan/xylan/chitin deacetylase (PgdA/CDA1 family)